MMPLSASRFSAVLLGPPGHARGYVSQTLLALVVCVMFAAMQHAEVLFGLIDRQESNVLTAAYLSGALLFYGLARSGLNQRFRDPGLAIAQATFFTFVLAGSYAITGPARGAVMTLVVLVMSFALFSVSPAQARRMALFAFVLLAAVMWWKSQTDPVRYPPRVELIHAWWAGIVLFGVTVLAGRLGRMRLRLKAQQVELRQALAQIGELAIRDELTGLYNRRHMNTLLVAEQARQRRHGAKMTIALLDIDLFKRINDDLGHAAGDKVLQLFAEAGRTALRATDVLARWGGEEFLLMLPGTPPSQALAIVERLRSEFDGVSFDSLAPHLHVTFSAGLSACGDDDELEGCIELADQAMYRAKVQGRNCSVLA